MNDAPDLVLITELDDICIKLQAEDGLGRDLLAYLQDMPKHIRAALAKRLTEDI
jgi:hypothetical protein